MGSNHRKIIIPEIVTEKVLNNPEDTYKTPALLDILFKYFFKIFLSNGINTYYNLPSEQLFKIPLTS